MSKTYKDDKKYKYSDNLTKKRIRQNKNKNNHDPHQNLGNIDYESSYFRKER